MRRVVVTGLGAVSPLGLDVASTWEAILAGKCGIEKITHFDASQFGAQIAGEVKGFEASDWLPAKEARRFDRFIAYACAAGMQALDDAQLTFSEENEEEANRSGCIIGSGIGGLDMLCSNYRTLIERGPRRVSPFMIPGTIINLASGELSILRHLKGPNLTTVTACASVMGRLGRSTMMVLAVTLHNIPEGMAVGVVYAGFLAGNAQITAASALVLSLGIAIQNFPEGAIISMPLRAEGESKDKTFLGGVLSGVVEPVGAMLTILAAQLVIPALPYFLSFAAGAMLYVVVEELIPEMSQGKHSDIGTVFFAVGFSVMMTLDVALG